MVTSLKQSSFAIFFVIIFLMSTVCVPEVSAAPILDTDIPRNADANQTINVFVNITSNLPIYEVKLYYENTENGSFNGGESMVNISGTSTNGTWHFAIPPQVYKGSIDVWILASDVSGTPTRYPSTGGHEIEIEGPERDKPFPWNIVVMVAFLAIVLVATELIFKPGIYRPTGRQRAQALEEEDREKELEEQEKM